MAAISETSGVAGGLDAALWSQGHMAVASWAQQVQGLSHSSRCLLSGAIGGPLVVGFLTPQRNAMTLAAKTIDISYFGLYRTVFKDGLMRGFRGGSRPTLSACPQFTAIGPIYLWSQKHTNSPAFGMVFASFIESLCTYSAQRKNAQIQFNASRSNAAEHVVIEPIKRLTGPGFTCHVLRNIFAMMGIRLISPYSLEVVKAVPGSSYLNTEGKLISADLVSSVIAATMSMPFNHVFSWASCTPELKNMTYTGRAKAMSNFIFGNYYEQGVRLLGRDLAVRISYTGLLFTLYAAVERSFIGQP